MTGPFQFTHPAYLLLLPPAVWIVWRSASGSFAGLSPGRARLSAALRTLLVTVLVLALTGIQRVQTTRSVCTLFLLDVSASVSPSLRQNAVAYINAAAQRMEPGDRAGVIVFGKEAYIEVSPRPVARGSRLCPPKIRSNPSPEFSDLSAALRLAMAAFPPGMGRRIVLLSDGNENLGRAREQTLAAKANGVQIDAVALDAGVTREARLDRMLLPRQVKKGEPFELKLLAASRVAASGVVRIMEDGKLTQTRPVDLPAGKTVLSFPMTQEKPGFHRYLALLDVRPDARPENNRAVGFVEVKGKPRVLIVEGTPAQGTFLAKALASQGIEAELRGPEGMPADLPALQGYDSLILSDVPATQLSPAQMGMIKTAVRDLGMGFGMVGGENGFGAGGYYRTPVEDALPVTMDIRKQRVFPSMSLAVAMDKSGSMGATENGVEKVRLAAEAAVAVMEVLQPIDRVGIIAFDSEPKVVAPLTEARSRDSVAADVTSIRAGGGTNVYPALREAHAMVAASDARIKHVILLADGADAAGQQGCVPLAAQMSREKVTLTVVSIGTGPDVPFLRELARAGGGNFYLTDRAGDLPRIFTKDAMLMSKSLLIEGPFLPRVNPDDEVMRGIRWGEVPPLLGYVATTPRAVADVPAVSPQNDPVFARWRYGLGRSFAFTSDAKARWAARWVGWGEFNLFWAQAVRWGMRRTDRRNFQITVETDQGRGRAVLDAADEDGTPLNFLRPNARVVMPDSTVREVQLDQTGLGRYEGSFPAEQVGVYLLHAQAVLPDGKSVSLTDGASIPYPPEYQSLEPNLPLLNGLAMETGGMTQPTPGQVFQRRRTLTEVPTDLWWLLVLMVALLFPLDVAVRRLLIGLPELEAAWTRVRAKTGARPAPAPVGTGAAVHVDRLLTVKSRRARSHGMAPPPHEQHRESPTRRSSMRPVRHGADPPPAAPDSSGDRDVSDETPPPVTAFPGNGAGGTEPEDSISPEALTDRLLAAKRRASRRPKNGSGSDEKEDLG
ncbi:MAG: VWA domain-containing protein [Armatimonadetes bacterium]|nr:VWA domain-containing protein [Armatimonadota bacterium]